MYSAPKAHFCKLLWSCYVPWSKLYGALALLDQQGAISQFVFWGVDEETAKRIGRLPQGKGVLGPDVLGKKGSLRLENLAEHPQATGFPEHHPHMRSLVATIKCWGGCTYAIAEMESRFSPKTSSRSSSLPNFWP